MFFGGLVLAVGGCGFFLSDLNLNSSATSATQVVGGIAFAAGCISFLIGGLTGLVYLLQALFRSATLDGLGFRRRAGA